MNQNSPLILIGVGTAGCNIARGVSRAFGEDLRYVLADTDAASGIAGGPFVLMGGDRLSGRGAGGDIVSARLAAEESIQTLNEHIEGVRLAVIVTALGGGTGAGVTLEAVKHLTACGIPAIVFATTPFAFEGADRQRNARGLMSMIEDATSASFFLPLDKLVQGEDNMDTAMRRAIDTVATGVTLFWRLIERPGYIRLDAERIRHLIAGAGRGRFAAVSAQGPNRATEAIDRITRAELLTAGSSPIRTILCGILAGNDLRLTEVGQIADGLRTTFGERTPFELGTVNDEATFSGRLSVVIMLFEENAGENGKGFSDGPTPAKRHRSAKNRNPLSIGPTGRGLFNNAEPTSWNGEDLDIPTFVRRNINLEF